MTQAAKSQEPSMEEILASIRRIIADDDATKSGQRPPEPAPAPPPRAAAPPQVAVPEPIGPVNGLAPPSFPVPAPAPVDEPSPDILELTDSMAVSAPSAAPAAVENGNAGPPQFRRIEGHSDVGFGEPSERPPMPKPAEAPLRPRGRSEEERSELISSDTSAAINSAFNTLAQTVLVQNARTLEDLVREMLRPMLKSWLDDNLPALVERLVRAEIERVSRGRMA
jgi:uncharacterized protein